MNKGDNQATQTKCLRPLLKFTRLDHQRNTRKLKKKHVKRMQINRLPKLPLYYKPIRKINEVVPENNGNANNWITAEGAGLISLKM